MPLDSGTNYGTQLRLKSKTSFMDDNKRNETPSNTDRQSDVYNRPGSNEHNDYSITGNKKEENRSKKRDEKESYMDYNGNSEENNPAKST